MDERIKEHLKRLNQYRLQLEELRGQDLRDLHKDAIIRAATERTLHLAVESCINIGNRLISLIQFEKPVETPETYADIFLELHRLGILERDLADQLVKMAKFRNRLVHLYWEVDEDVIYQILQNNLGDLEKFQEKIVNYFNKKARNIES